MVSALDFQSSIPSRSQSFLLSLHPFCLSHQIKLYYSTSPGNLRIYVTRIGKDVELKSVIDTMRESQKP